MGLAKVRTNAAPWAHPLLRHEVGIKNHSSCEGEKRLVFQICADPVETQPYQLRWLETIQKMQTWSSIFRSRRDNHATRTKKENFMRVNQPARQNYSPVWTNWSHCSWSLFCLKHPYWFWKHKPPPNLECQPKPYSALEWHNQRIECSPFQRLGMAKN